MHVSSKLAKRKAETRNRALKLVEMTNGASTRSKKMLAPLLLVFALALTHSYATPLPSNSLSSRGAESVDESDWGRPYYRHRHHGHHWHRYYRRDGEVNEIEDAPPKKKKKGSKKSKDKSSKSKAPAPTTTPSLSGLLKSLTQSGTNNLLGSREVGDSQIEGGAQDLDGGRDSDLFPPILRGSSRINPAPLRRPAQNFNQHLKSPSATPSAQPPTSTLLTARSIQVEAREVDIGNEQEIRPPRPLPPPSPPSPSSTVFGNGAVDGINGQGIRWPIWIPRPFPQKSPAASPPTTIGTTPTAPIPAPNDNLGSAARPHRFLPPGSRRSEADGGLQGSPGDAEDSMDGSIAPSRDWFVTGSRRVQRSAQDDGGGAGSTDLLSSTLAGVR